MKLRDIGIALYCAVAVVTPSADLVADEAEYRIVFQGGWTLEPLPGGAHFSPLIGATHAEPNEIFAVGELASLGVERVAELGSTGVLVNEINSKIQDGSVGSLILRAGNIGPESVVSIDVTVSAEHSMLSLLTMIAPSPDWFVGVNSLELRDGSQWRDKMVLELNSYDAGTEEGQEFSLNNPPTNPKEPIAGLDEAEPENPLFGFGSIATVSITRLDTGEFAVGDVNQDGVIDLLDVAPFVDAVNAGDFQHEADANCDGAVNLLDVQPFIELLAG